MDLQIFTACVFGQSSTHNVPHNRSRPGTVTLPDNKTYDLDEDPLFVPDPNFAFPSGEPWGQGLVGKSGVAQAFQRMSVRNSEISMMQSWNDFGHDLPSGKPRRIYCE